MKNLRLAAAASVAVAVSVLSAHSAQAYPDSPNVTIAIPSSDLVGGNTFTFTASADVDCDWTVTYKDGRAAGVPADQTGSGKSVSGSYDTKAVSKTFRSPITATCAYDANASGSSTSAGKNDTASASATVTLLPVGSTGDGDSDAGTGNGEGGSEDGNGILPDTGGSNLWILVAGGALVLVGGGAVIASRRRQVSR
ncbi:LPXTG cell wall anchor domain-containing protein [Aeromicrobium sp. P5_D10]